MVKHRKHLALLWSIRKGFLEEWMFELYSEAIYMGGGREKVQSAKELW